MPAYFNLLKERNPERRAPLKGDLMDHLKFIETVALANVSEVEPYWMGGDATLVDYTFYPFFERFAAVETYRGIAIPADYQRLHGWLNSMHGREVVRRLAHPRDYYVEHLGKIYADQ